MPIGGWNGFSRCKMGASSERATVAWAGCKFARSQSVLLLPVCHLICLLDPRNPARPRPQALHTQQLLRHAEARPFMAVTDAQTLIGLVELATKGANGDPALEALQSIADLKVGLTEAEAESHQPLCSHDDGKKGDFKVSCRSTRDFCWTHRRASR